MKYLKTLQTKETGLISIIVTIIIMFVLSVTIMSFATLMRREQRQVLDRQLNTQAFYAAEAGINDAIIRIRELALSDPYNVLGSSYTTDCQGFKNAVGSPLVNKPLEPNVQPGDTNVSYSCLLVDPRPRTLEYASVDRNPQVVPIKAGSGTLDTIIINWQATDGSANFSCPGGALSSPDLASNSQWTCTTGLLRIDLVQTPSTFTRDALNSNLRAVFLYPQPGAIASHTVSSTQTGEIVNAGCQNPAPAPSTKYCTVRLSVTPAVAYYLRMSSIYRTSSVTISATSGGSPVDLVGAQAMIDSTGKANDILRRIQVRASINPLGNGPFPIGAIQSVNTLCKQFSVIPPDNTVDNPGNSDCDVN